MSSTPPPTSSLPSAGSSAGQPDASGDRNAEERQDEVGYPRSGKPDEEGPHQRTKEPPAGARKSEKVLGRRSEEDNPARLGVAWGPPLDVGRIWNGGLGGLLLLLLLLVGLWLAWVWG